MSIRKCATLAVVALVASIVIQPAMAGVGGCRSGVGGCRGWGELNQTPIVTDRPSNDRTPSIFDALTAILPGHVVVLLRAMVEEPQVDGIDEGVGGCRGRGGVGGCVL